LGVCSCGLAPIAFFQEAPFFWPSVREYDLTSQGLRPSIASRNGSQKLEDGMGSGFFRSKAFKCTPNPVVTCMAGFAVSAFDLRL